VATAAQVVAGAVAISVETAGGTYTASVEHIDETADLASLRLSEPDPGHVFRFTPADPRPGTTASVIGYPLDGPLSISEGTVSGVDRVVETDAGPLGGLLQTDAAVNPGNFGGPIVTPPGDVAGVISGVFTATRDWGSRSSRRPPIPGSGPPGTARPWGPRRASSRSVPR
jgi:serine protease Do